MSDKPVSPPALSPERNLGEVVRRLRERAGLTRQELASAVNLSAATLRTMEQGRPAPLASWLALAGHRSMHRLRALARHPGTKLPRPRCADLRGTR